MMDSRAFSVRFKSFYKILGINTRVEAYKCLKTILGRFRAYSLMSRQMSIAGNTQTRLKLGIILSKYVPRSTNNHYVHSADTK